MSTHEPEITSEVRLCGPDGRHLAPDAAGWSRVPLHDANLRGRWGRTKRWDYWAILAEDLVVSVVYADVDYLGLADSWWLDRRTGVTGGRQNPIPLARGIALPDRPGTAPLRHRGSKSTLDIVDDGGGTSISATWTEPGGEQAVLDARVDLPDGHESLNVVIPWSDTTFQYTSKHQARPARGTLTIGDRVHRFGVPAEDGEPVEGATPAWGVLDVGRGRWPYSTRWNWGGGAGTSTDGRTIGIQVGAKWTEGTGFTENGIIVDGRLTKIGQELTWDYDWEAPMEPWRVHLPDGSFDITLVPDHDKHSRTNALVLATEVHQVFGRWSGHMTDADGNRHVVRDILGFAEESRSRW